MRKGAISTNCIFKYDCGAIHLNARSSFHHPISPQFGWKYWIEQVMGDAQTIDRKELQGYRAAHHGLYRVG